MKPEPTQLPSKSPAVKRISFETGKLAKQAHGSVVVRIGENVVLATAVANRRPARQASIFSRSPSITANTPTLADAFPAASSSAKAARVNAKFSPAGRSIGRSARCSPKASSARRKSLLSCSPPIPRTIPTSSASTAAPAALTISDIPFLGPIGAVRVGLVDGRFIANPTYTEMRESLLNIMVVGTAEAS